MDARDELGELRHQAVLWALGQAWFEPVVRAACDALVAGHDGDQLRQLAAESVHSETRGTLDGGLVDLALEEQGIPMPRERDELLRVAMVELARDVVRKERPPREIAEWAHRVIGHDGPEEFQAFVFADDEYDVADDEDASSRIDVWMITCCQTVGSLDAGRFPAKIDCGSSS